MLKLIKSRHGGEIYDIAAAEFCKYYRQITGEELPVITEDDKESDLIVLGSDADNEYAAECMLAGRIPRFSIRYGSDDFYVRSAELDGRRHLFLGGGRNRAVLYAVYTYFEEICGCRWFWDGDCVPQAESICLEQVNICESPRFLYRGLRYFAHRGLHRFQAEQWGYEDWTREIDWMLKKRLNIFMLRIGNDDIFQKAFPDKVAYPDPNQREMDQPAYHDRTSAWPLEYRGRLRGKILAYAFARDLMHPEDCGTTTHWYTPTPTDFLEHEKPEFFVQASKSYNFPEELVWDIRKERNMNNYIQLTETHMREYGREGLFHTIGFAERMFSEDRQENLRMKLFVYHKLISYIRAKHPNTKLLIASWDLWQRYTSEEVRELVKELDPEVAIILDYTSDTRFPNNFTKWDVVGKFPYIFGIFQAYCSNSGAVGDYKVIEERLQIAAADDQCKGLVFWPELSHGDTFMLEYFPQNAWKPLGKSLNGYVEDYCKSRYGACSGKMLPVYQAFMDFVPLITWDLHQVELFFTPMKVIDWVLQEEPRMFSEMYVPASRLRRLSESAVFILNTLAEMDPGLGLSGEMLMRDIYDLARVVTGRYIHTGLHEVMLKMVAWKQGGRKPETVVALLEQCRELTGLLMEILGQHPDYSMLRTYEKLADEAPVNKCFEITLKENATCDYNRTYVYEHVKHLYLPELELVQNWVEDSLNAGSLAENTAYWEAAGKIKEAYMALPLDQVDRNVRQRKEVFEEAANRIRTFFPEET